MANETKTKLTPYQQQMQRFLEQVRPVLTPVTSKSNEDDDVEDLGLGTRDGGEFVS